MVKWTLASVCLVLGGVVGLVAGPLQGGKPAPPPVAPSEVQSYRDIVQCVLPGVVSIETKPGPMMKAKQPPPKRKGLSDDAQIPEQFRKFFDQFDLESPQPGPSRGFGSGFIVDSKGVIVTNHHVVQGAEQVVVHLHDGRRFVSKEIKNDPQSDLAIIRIDSKSPLPALELGNSEDMEIGDRVLAVGAPFGLAGSVTSGIISAKSRSLRTNGNGEYLQTDAAINPGNSGGPLVNMQGQVIGVTTAIKSSTGGSQGVGLAISSKVARNVVHQLTQNGIVARGYLGVQIKDLDPEIAVRLGVDNQAGVLVAKVLEGTPAAKAGLHSGDVITAIAGKTVHSGAVLQNLIGGLAIGQSAEIAFVRDGKAKSLNVTIATQPTDTMLAGRPLPPSPGEEPRVLPLEKLGIELQDMTPEFSRKQGFKGEVKGAFVARVENQGPADEAGLERGMVIVKVDNVAVASADAARTALNKASLENGVLVEVKLPQSGVDYILLKAL